MIEMDVQAIALDAQTHQPIVILNDQAKLRALPIWIGVAEASAIGRALEEIKAERPMTHDLMLNLIEQFAYSVKQVEINELAKSTYYATIRLVPKAGLNLGEKAIDARPSDAIALAMVAKAPILVSPEIMAEATIPADLEKDKAEAEEFKNFLESVKASDFKTEGIGPIGPAEHIEPEGP